jgi:hypothetical protein
MLKLTLLSLATLSALGLSANDAAAQCACGGSAPMVSANGPVATDTQTYQRYSYSPTEIAQPTMAASQMIMGQPASTDQPMMRSAVVAPRSQVQSYRRFSYQPSTQARSSNSSRKERWQYSKTDPRKYQN